MPLLGLLKLLYQADPSKFMIEPFFCELHFTLSGGKSSVLPPCQKISFFRACEIAGRRCFPGKSGKFSLAERLCVRSACGADILAGKSENA